MKELLTNKTKQHNFKILKQKLKVAKINNGIINGT